MTHGDGGFDGDPAGCGARTNRRERGDPELPPGPARDLVDLYRRLRNVRWLSGGQIALKTGLSPGHISDVLRGWKAPSPDAATRIATVLGAGHQTAQRARQLAEELKDLNRYNQSRRRHVLARMPDQEPWPSVRAASQADCGLYRGPQVLQSGDVRLYAVTGITEQPERRVGTVTGDIRRVRCADVWVNSENTEMRMARFDEFSVSSIIRYEGAVRDDVGRVVDDRIAVELAGKLAGRQPVPPGTAIVTGPGELSRCRVRHVVHVAAVQGEPGAGYRQVREVGRCITNVMAEVDGIDARPAPVTILCPLLGTGHGGGDLPTTISSLVGAVIDYFTSTPGTHITTVFFLAYTDSDLSACEMLLAANQRLQPTTATRKETDAAE
jgi:O-acetyl-ADP-ribose deacetylase (regulator of RNase III)